jgi:hypothetical protein
MADDRRRRVDLIELYAAVLAKQYVGSAAISAGTAGILSDLGEFGTVALRGSRPYRAE